MFGLGTGELLLIGIVIFIFVGPKKLPQLGASLAKAIRNFKQGMNGVIEDSDKDDSSNHNKES